MKVYILNFGDYEGTFYISVWSTKELAQEECGKLNALALSCPNYYYEEVEVDSGD